MRLKISTAQSCVNGEYDRLRSLKPVFGNKLSENIMFTSENKYGMFILYGYNLFVIIILALMFGSMFYNMVGICNCLGR